ncbi:MAG: carbohydrate deacetylase [Bryobacteraceae bacterium]
MRQLVINADDFGFTRDVNAGIVHAHREGVLTSTTLMANGDAFEDAVRLARETPTLDVGCHLVLVQGRSLITGRAFPETPREVVAALVRRHLDVYAELRAQIEKILAAGITPSHLDSHKHTHIVPSVFKVVIRLAQEFRIPFVRLPLDRTAPYAKFPCAVADPLYRRTGQRVDVRMTDHFIGFRLTGTLNEQSFASALGTLEQGSTEFMCHPGYLGSELRNAPTRLKEARVRELEALTSFRIREVLNETGIRLATFRTLS